jgi:dTDP-L-rhamnose 4-epimerase
LEPPVHRRRQKPDYIPDVVEFIQGDVCNRVELEKALRGVDAVFHLAAHMNYLPDFSKFAAVNDVGTALLYEIIANKKLPIRKVVVASSQAVYGEAKYECQAHGVQYPSPRTLEQLRRGIWDIQCPQCGGDLRPIPIDESTAHPHNQYAVSKYCQELYALTLGKRYDIPTVALRYSITQGPRQSFSNAYSGLLRIFTLRLLNGLPPIIYEDGKQLRDYVYVGDVAAANLLVLENEAADYEVYNVGGSEVLSVSEYADLILRVTGAKVTPQVPGEFRFGDTRHAISDISKLKGLGWAPQTTVEQTVVEYVAWVKSQPGAIDHYGEAEETMKKAGTIRSVEV